MARARVDGRRDRVEIVLVTLAMYALVMPRMKDYSYVALLPVAWYALSRPTLQTVPLGHRRGARSASAAAAEALAAAGHAGVRLRAARRRAGRLDGDHRRTAGADGAGVDALPTQIAA